MTDFERNIETELAALSAAGNRRELHTIRCGGATARLDGVEYANFSGNDYLGIAGDAAWHREFYARMTDGGAPEWGLSAASSRLLTGNSAGYDRLEAALAAWYGGGRRALVFNSGYHANIGILPALSAKGDLVLSDKLNHASIIDGLRLCEAEYRRYRHLDFNHLESLLKPAAAAGRRIFIVTESIFSMDGDTADLKALVELKHRYGALLVVDEAHAVGVCGPAGTGWAAAQGVAAEIDVLIGTFGKAFGSTGAYAIVDPPLRDWLINRMRTLIFTTGLPPVVLAWSAFVLDRMPSLEARRARLREMGETLRRMIASRGYPTGGESQIVPLVAGENQAAIDLAVTMRAGGVLVFPIRPPTVPAGTARLRFSLNAALSDADLARVEAGL